MEHRTQGHTAGAGVPGMKRLFSSLPVASRIVFHRLSRRCIIVTISKPWMVTTKRRACVQSHRHAPWRGSRYPFPKAGGCLKRPHSPSSGEAPFQAWCAVLSTTLPCRRELLAKHNRTPQAPGSDQHASQSRCHLHGPCSRLFVHHAGGLPIRLLLLCFSSLGSGAA